MNTQYEKYLGEIPAYLAGQLELDALEAFEAFAESHPEFQRELEEMRSTFEWMGAEFSVAGKTDFRLSSGRRAALRRETDVNVIAFPAVQDVARETRFGTFGRVSGWLTVAASLLIAAYMGLGLVSEQGEISEDSLQTAVRSTGVVTEPVSDYEYVPAYGLDRPDPWRISESSYEIAIGYAMLESEMARPSGETESDVWRYDSLGLDGPRPFYSLSVVRGLGAI